MCRPRGGGGGEEWQKRPVSKKGGNSRRTRVTSFQIQQHMQAQELLTASASGFCTSVVRSFVALLDEEVVKATANACPWANEG